MFSSPLFASCRTISFFACSLIVIGLLSGCDVASFNPDEAPRPSVLYEGVRYQADTPALALAIQDGQVVAETTLGGAVSIATPGPSKGDVFFRLDGLRQGSVFTAAVVDEADRAVAALEQHAQADRFDVYAVTPGLQAERAELTLLQAGEVVFSQEVSIDPGQKLPLGTTLHSASSKHYVWQDGRILIVFDYEQRGLDEDAVWGQTLVQPAGSAHTYEATHIQVTLHAETVPDLGSIRFSQPPGSRLTFSGQQFK
ncbi:MAG: hypothetical protein AAGI71_11000 [Bacteroidota bacterium]